MKIGTYAYPTRRGLGHLARDFYTHSIVTDVCVVRHPGVPNVDEWYPGAPTTHLRNLNTRLMQDFAAGMDAMLFFETPFWWPIVPFCRERGIRTYLIPMYECTPTGHQPPDRYLCPSLLDMQYFPQRSEFIPLPVDYPWRLRTHATHYVHNGGYLGLRGREGTTLLIEAMRYVKSPLRLTIRVQENVGYDHQQMMAQDKRIEYIAGTVPYEDLYGIGDVVVQPQKFNGCSLPLQEACASGMLVMTTDRFPMNTWLTGASECHGCDGDGSLSHMWAKEECKRLGGYAKAGRHGPLNYYTKDGKELGFKTIGGPCDVCDGKKTVSPLIPVAGYQTARIGGGYLPFEEAQIEPRDIAATMDAWYGREIERYSLAGKAWGEAHSWAALRERWLKAVQS